MRSSSTPVSSLRFSRVFFFAAGLAAVSAVGCGGGPTDSVPATTSAGDPSVAQAVAAAPAAVAETAPPAADQPATPPSAGHHRHGPFAMLETLDLRAEQRAKIDTIKTDLETKLEAGRKDGLELASLLATGIETGKLDDSAVRQRRVAVQQRVDEARRAIGDAANAVHATLDPAQRAELVLTMRAKHEARPAEQQNAEGGERRHRHGFGRLTSELGLTAEQTKSLHEGMRSIFEAAFPDRKERREQLEVERKAAEDAFMSETFDAHRYTFGTEAVRWMQTAAVGATALSDLATSVLTNEQRALLAQKIREGTAAR